MCERDLPSNPKDLEDLASDAAADLRRTAAEIQESAENMGGWSESAQKLAEAYRKAADTIADVGSEIKINRLYK
jgi:hypothetical protein